MKKDTYYFPHDSNAKDDPKCVMLIEQLGMEGYGIYWMLIETLREQPNYEYPLDLLPALARRYNTTAEKIKAVVTCYNLFLIKDEKIFLSESLLRRMNEINSKRERFVEAAKARWNNGLDATHKQRISDANATHVQFNAIKEKESKVNQSKSNESKVKESKENNRLLAQSIVDSFNSICVSLPKVSKLTEARISGILQRLKDMGGTDKAIEIINRVERSDFLTGRKTDFKANFDWIFLCKGNWIKINEGNYDNVDRTDTKSANKSKEQELFASHIATQLGFGDKE